MYRDRKETVSMRQLMRAGSLRISIVVILLVFSTGCICRMAGIAPSSCPITGRDTYTIIGPVTAYAYGVALMGVPICENDQAKLCLKRALEKSGGDALIEVTMDNGMLFLYYICPMWTRIEATAIKFERGGAKE